MRRGLSGLLGSLAAVTMMVACTPQPAPPIDVAQEVLTEALSKGGPVAGFEVDVDSVDLIAGDPLTTAPLYLSGRTLPPARPYGASLPVMPASDLDVATAVARVTTQFDRCEKKYEAASVHAMSETALLTRVRCYDEGAANSTPGTAFINDHELTAFEPSPASLATLQAAWSDMTEAGILDLVTDLSYGVNGLQIQYGVSTTPGAQFTFVQTEEGAWILGIPKTGAAAPLGLDKISAEQVWQALGSPSEVPLQEGLHLWRYGGRVEVWLGGDRFPVPGN